MNGKGSVHSGFFTLPGNKKSIHAKKEQKRDDRGEAKRNLRADFQVFYHGFLSV
jgi:hypothetical protein